VKLKTVYIVCNCLKKCGYSEKEIGFLIFDLVREVNSIIRKDSSIKS